MGAALSRETHTWTDAELAYLEAYYALHGSSYIRARFPHLSQDAVRQMASRLNLAEDMQEFVPAADVTREAGTTPTAVLNWVQERGYRRHCRTWGWEVLLPLPVVRLYLHERRTNARPRGWWGSARAAERTGVSVPTLAANVPHVLYGRTAYYRPEDVMTYAAQLQTPPPNHLPLRALTGPGSPRQKAEVWLTQNGTPARAFKVPRKPGKPALYVHADHARQFLTARGYHEQLVEELLSAALTMQASGVKSDTEER